MSALLAVLFLPHPASGQAAQGGPLPGPLPLFPPDNWWNADVSSAPLDPNSESYIAYVGATRGLHPDFGGDAGYPAIYGMPYVTVPGIQPLEIFPFDYAGESDAGAPSGPRGYPVPVEAKTQPHWIEGGYPGNSGVLGDKHMLIVDTDHRLLFELFNLRCTPTDSPACSWRAGSGAVFPLDQNLRRPDGWTSADAAGLAILPGLVRYDEVYGSAPIGHAFRVTVRATNGYVYPASHRAGSTSGALPMGARLRLKASKDISGFSAPLQQIFQTMKTHGLIVADNGTDLYVTGTYDTRWDNSILNPAFAALKGGDFEVVQLGWRPSAPPVAVNDVYSLFVNTTLSVGAPGVLSNDTAPDGDTLQAFLVDSPENGMLTLNRDGSFQYVPNSGFIGTDTFTYKAHGESSGLESSPATVALTVRAAVSTRVVPILLESPGKGGALFSSELIVANRGIKPLTLTFTYAGAIVLGGGRGSGSFQETLEPGRQRLYRSALDYLRGVGLQIPTTLPEGGTLRLTLADLSSASAVYAGARTTAAVGPGRAGVAYPAVLLDNAATSPVALFGLRDNAADRTNLALVNAGDTGAVLLHVTLHPANGGAPIVLDDVSLGAGQWTQINGVLAQVGLTAAWATVKRISGTEPFIAYAVFNDNLTNDGSYIPSVLQGRAPAVQVLPVLVESAAFESELVLANPGTKTATATLTYIESKTAPFGATGTIVETLQPGEQRIIPSAIQYLRSRDASIGPRGLGTYVGSLSVSFRADGTLSDGFVGARTASPAPDGGGYGLFMPAVPTTEAATSEAWIYGLEQNESNRSNLALVNAGSAGTITLQAYVYNGDTRVLVATLPPVTLTPGAWTQMNAVLAPYGATNGYVRVVRTSGSEPFVAYGVVNDGAVLGQGTSDGSYVAMVVTSP